MPAPGDKWIPDLAAAPDTTVRPAQKIARGELDREKKRVLVRLAAPGARLAPVADGTQFALRVGKSSTRGRRTKVQARYVEAFMREGLLAHGQQDDDRDAGDRPLVLSDLGHKWVARFSANAQPFRAQHQIDSTRMINGRGAGTKTALTPLRVNLAETPLGWLRCRKGADGKALISEAQFEAGERLRADFTAAQMTPRVTADWSMPLDASHTNAGDRMDVSERAIAARQRFYRAVDAVGPGLAEPLIDVCCYLNGIKDAERRMGWPQRSGKVVLAIALERLADHYGFNGAKTRRRGITAWHAGAAK